MAPKKAAKAEASSESSHKYAIGDIVLGRIKGYPAWPAKIIDPETEYLTKSVLKQKPKFACFLLRFYVDANYAWSTAKDLKPLPARAIEDYLSDTKKAKGALLKAYQTAQDPSEWEKEHAVANAAARDEAANKDELESEGEGGEDGSKKRKRKAEPKKAANGKGKAKATRKSKGDSEDELAEKPKKKAKTAKGGDDEAPGFKQCKDWRRELQKGLLDATPKAEAMAGFDKIFTDIEAYDDKVEYLEAHKLPKVVKRIANLDNLPGDDEYKIKSRAAAVVDKWAKLFHPNGVPAETKDEPSSAKPAAEETNGKMEVDEPATAQQIEAAAESTAAAAEETVKVDDAPAADPTEPSKTGADHAMDASGEAAAPSGTAAPAETTA